MPDEEQPTIDDLLASIRIEVEQPPPQQVTDGLDRLRNEAAGDGSS